ncbi:MAG: zinc-binding dehydrogenase [Chloroflexota bacterium]
MKAIYLNEQGDYEKFIYGDLPEPVPAPDEVLIRIHAAAVNRRDTFEREGSHGIRIRQQHVPGIDLAGTVEQLGDYVAFTGKLAKGDRVMGVGRGGSYAEYGRAHMDFVVKIPDWLSYEEAAAIPTVYAAAYQALLVRAEMRLGEDVLVMAAGSGVGSAAIQLAHAAGCRVLTTASSDEKLEKAKALGADIGINYREHPKFSEQVLAHTDKRGVDLLYEHIGSSVFEQAYRSLAVGGRMVYNGVTAGHLAEIHLGRLWTREMKLIGATFHPSEDLPAIARLVERRTVRGVVDRVFPLAEAAAAHKLLESNQFFGKVILATG